MRCLPLRALLFAALSPLLVAQQPAADPKFDAKQVRKAAAAAVQAKDYMAAAAGFRRLTEANPKDAQAWHMLGYSLHAQGLLDEALPVHEKTATFPATAAPGTYNAACVHALQGRADLAFTWLDKAVAAGFDDAELLRTDSDLAAIRKDPRMAKVVAAVDAKAAMAPEPYVQTVERKNSRVAWFTKKGAPQFAIDWTPVPWQDAYDAQLAAGEFLGKKWRFGGDYWTALDTTVPLELGGVKVPAGHWYLTLEQRAADTFVLGVHDAAAVKAQKLDAYMTGRLQGGIEVPLQHGKAEAVKALDIAFATTAGGTSEGTLTIRFGGHALTTKWSAAL